MAQSDLETFIRERVAAFDENLDTTDGSPFDVQVTQPILRRLGTDPFTVNYTLFARERINQDFPDLATKEGDAITDLLIKTGQLIFNPLVRENQRVQNNLSFKDPTTLTLDEAEALGANLFSERNRGTFSRGQVRIYFAQPQSQSVSPSNFVTTKEGLHFFPDSVQSIRVDEMLLNLEGTLYYFDINVIAESPGDQYNIDIDDVVSIANVSSAVRITNKRRFRFGNPDETAVDFVDRTQQELSERSLVTLRGIGAQITKTFPEVSRLAVVGFQDPEMQRDIIEGGGLGEIRAAGTQATPINDGSNSTNTHWLTMAEDDAHFTDIIGPTVPPNVWFLTLVDPTSGAVLGDHAIASLIDSHTVVLADTTVPNQPLLRYIWTLRKKELTLSKIPGGILFPDGPNGTVTIPDATIHIGGTTDVFIRGNSFDTSSLVLESVVDESPILSGTKLQIIDSNGNVSLGDIALSVDYLSGDSTFIALTNAKTKSFSLQIVDGPAAGSYRVIDVVQTAFAAPILTLDPAPLGVTGTDFRWRLLDVLDLDLVAPKDTRITASDGVSTQGVASFESATGIDFEALGVSVNDILQIMNGPVAGLYTIKAVLSPFFTRLQVDRPFTNSTSNLSYSIYRPNSTGGIIRPFVRVTSIDLLDTSGQPVGSTIPYAKPVDVQSKAFANIAHGVKVDLRDALLGIVSLPFPAGAAVSGMTLSFTWNAETASPSGPTSVLLTGSNPLNIDTIASQINTALGQNVAFNVEGSRLGVASLGGETRVTGGAGVILFGDNQMHSTRDIRTPSGPTWTSLDINSLDVVQVLDGFQVGFYGNPVPRILGVDNSSALITGQNFFPEAGRHVQVGSRSIGSARLFFLEPTSIEFDIGSKVSIALENGITLNYFPDPTNQIQKIPGLPSGVKPTDGQVVGAPTNLFTSASIDFVKKAILPGDNLVIDYVPITGEEVLADPVPDLALTSIILSVDGGPDKTIIFINDSTSISSTDVTRAGVVSQINRAAGKTICSLIPVGIGKSLQFSADGSVVVRLSGTANGILGFSTALDTNNDSALKGTYVIQDVAPTQLTLSNTFSINQGNQGFKVFRPGGQRICSTQMANNKAEGGLFFFDLELVSEGTGDQWNIDASLAMTASGYDSDGYFLTCDDPDLSFSPIEQIRLHLSRSFLDVGVSDDPENATQLSGQNIQVNYERSTLTGNVNNFLTADTERVVNESPLGRHLTPFYVRFDLTYLGGSKENIVIPDLEALISSKFPNDPLEVSDIEQVVLNRGATSIQNPIQLMAVVHNTDRTIRLVRSENSINTGRLAAFIPDVLNVVRKFI